MRISASALNAHAPRRGGRTESPTPTPAAGQAGRTLQSRTFHAALSPVAFVLELINRLICLTGLTSQLKQPLEPTDEAYPRIPHVEALRAQTARLSVNDTSDGKIARGNGMNHVLHSSANMPTRQHALFFGSKHSREAMSCPKPVHPNRRRWVASKRAVYLVLPQRPSITTIVIESRL
jgi:hypothetical protein